MMNEQTLHLSAAVLMLASFILIVWGLGTAEWMWMTGLGCAVIAHLFALWVNWAPDKDDDEGGAAKEKTSDEGEAASV